VAGNIGVREVQHAAGNLEKAVAAKVPSSELASVLEDFRSKLDGFIGRLRTALPPEPAVPATAPAVVAFDAAQARPLVTEMLGHLGCFDPAANECLEAHRDVFRSVLPTEAFASFEQQVAGFAFADALGSLERAAREKGLLQP
jgi:hypothetical protein